MSAIKLQFDNLTPFPTLQPGPIATLGPNLQSAPTDDDSWTNTFPFFWSEFEFILKYSRNDPWAFR